MACLRAVETLGLPDCWIGAGAIRNPVWDRLHGFPIESGQGTDVDVVFHDPSDITTGREAAFEVRLAALVPGVDWQVRNQARMHLRNGDAPYADTEDGLRHWPETATAIAARFNTDEVELLAPFGLDDLLGLIVRPTAAFKNKRAIFEARRASKNWAARWPKLKFVD